VIRPKKKKAVWGKKNGGMTPERWDWKLKPKTAVQKNAVRVGGEWAVGAKTDLGGQKGGGSVQNQRGRVPPLQGRKRQKEQHEELRKQKVLRGTKHGEKEKGSGEKEGVILREVSRAEEGVKKRCCGKGKNGK